LLKSFFLTVSIAAGAAGLVYLISLAPKNVALVIVILLPFGMLWILMYSLLAGIPLPIKNPGAGPGSA
jgi:hypothetical protein